MAGSHATPLYGFSHLMSEKKGTGQIFLRPTLATFCDFKIPHFNYAWEQSPESMEPLLSRSSQQLAPERLLCGALAVRTSCPVKCSGLLRDGEPQEEMVHAASDLPESRWP